jgi:hypothetical protein
VLIWATTSGGVGEGPKVLVQALQPQEILGGEDINVGTEGGDLVAFGRGSNWGLERRGRQR